ncbi:type II toxin-antitoxin system RelE/ParE family toxin [Defluviicoccus vanus]|uniref:Type II toxin-antitoxin system RelE/ParE family toxin n=1 Tax=Defluviicoccus vanus TaxID=111831 RepID=A0A7H1N4F1_9PROT|nr:type II toxin-antitoxin system RelE/ParE family toxin [Defluviicoccus vanus]QNT70587.1 type II toxin-antitoxin system RelE/ParE family toxin [Defluviicoccus vanus]
MSSPLKKIPARFYRSVGGSEPVREWLKALDLRDRKAVGKDIQKVEYGWPLGLPVCRPLTNGLWEVRSNISDGRTVRVIFCIAGGCMVLLHGFIKKSQKTPQQDLELALKRKRDLET